MSANPCLTCGACCAHFRVSFYWGEADPAQGGTVPPDLTDDLTSFRRCMKGTDQRQPYCIALHGTIGQRVQCTIYADRPTPCREFGVDMIDGRLIAIPDDLARCTQARAAWGLPPLLPDLYRVPGPRHPFTRRAVPRHFPVEYRFWRRRRIGSHPTHPTHPRRPRAA